MKKILVTGAGGFIGSHLVEKCIEHGYKVKAFVHYNSKNSWGWLDLLEVKNEIEIFSGDIRDFDSVNASMNDVDTVFHLAALIGIPYSYVSPLAYIKTNIEGTYNVLQAAKEKKLENILITSTSEIYGTAKYVPIDENHPIIGQSPYAASKIGADQLAISYYRSFGLPVKVIRPFNTYGPRQSARAVIPTIITQCLSHKMKIELGNLSPTRDLTFVKDTANAFLEIARADRLMGEITNCGNNKEISIKNLALMICDQIGCQCNFSEIKMRSRPKNSEVERLVCDNTKILRNTIWEPEYSLSKGLEETIKWVKNNINTYKSDIYNV